MRKTLLILILVALSIPLWVSPVASLQKATPELGIVRKVLRTTPLVDGHNDLMRHFFFNTNRPGDFDAYDIAKRTRGQTDLPRLQQGMVGAQFITVAGLDDAAPARGVVEMIDFVQRMVERYPNQLKYAESSTDIRRAFASRRVAILLALEGGYQIENSLAMLRIYHRLGVRYMTLTHEAKSSEWAPAALDESRTGGLTPFGTTVVREMNRLGMLIDLSHASPSVMRDALAISAAPVIFSHSSAQHLVNTPRNVPDDILRLVKAKRGIVMVSFVPYFTNKEYAEWYQKGEALQQKLSQEFGKDREAVRREMRRWDDMNPPPDVSLEDVVRHVEHIREVAGIDHVGIGSDFDGMDGQIKGLEDVSKFPALFAALARRGWMETELRKLAGENFLRVFSEAEAIAARLNRISTGQPIDN